MHFVFGKSFSAIFHFRGVWECGVQFPSPPKKKKTQEKRDEGRDGEGFCWNCRTNEFSPQPKKKKTKGELFKYFFQFFLFFFFVIQQFFLSLKGILETEFTECNKWMENFTYSEFFLFISTKNFTLFPSFLYGHCLCPFCPIFLLFVPKKTVKSVAKTSKTKSNWQRRNNIERLLKV